MKLIVVLLSFFMITDVQAQTLTGVRSAADDVRVVEEEVAPVPPASAKSFQPSFSAASQPRQSEQPLEISADNTLEWMRDDQKFIARGKAVATQGTSSVVAETLTADYREGEESGIQIHTLTAEQNVVLSSKKSHAYGNVAIYDLDKGLATMTGQNLKMVSPDQTVTARDKFEYWVEEGRINAIGNAVAVRPKLEGGQDELRADVISAVLKDNAEGERVLHTLEAKGNVKITTPTEVATGRYGIYRASSNVAELQGDVVITRGPNILKGDRAEVDLNINTSKIFGGASAQNGRVSGTFFPGSQ